ncbi:sulfate ABC transporter permease subunit CysW [Spirulina major CS-329]|jgi:sulfate transport system permease protein|uniref:sulfate ABC transporter permease subunit CysW n=1 Tax=Spirulina TaxID=1154 RepID=UPI00232E82CB|nr:MULTISPECIES: sulfate ABC transporter permease subunit CysW [Spirulina]MDB9494318.1 sulfate ABC transporter permease subunit CysW [Spirulina subsalsa CS-330]MDB9502308.1 sulfate ABC transporter permease subunit CysW [Spirulina major CS-329]
MQAAKPASQLTSGQWLLTGLAVTYLGFLFILPALVVFTTAFSDGIPAFITALQSRAFLQATRLTLIVTAIAIPINTLFGLCAAWVIARNQFRGRTLLMSLVDLPFSVSPVVAGLMLVLLYSDRVGWFSPVLTALGVKIIFALPGIVLATLFVTLPFVAREVIPVLEELGSEPEEAARILGATPGQIFRRVILPHIRWGLLYGILLTNARALGEFGAVAVVSGSILGRTATLPIFVEQSYQNYQSVAAFSAAVVLAGLAVLTLIGKAILERYYLHKLPTH